jgi:SAM-dependent methyltransferase
VPRIGRDEGRRLFGADPAGYDLARPGHAERVYEVLVERCGLGPGTSVLEVGPGTGQATRRLLELGAGPLVALEPNPELAAYLRKSLGERIVIYDTALEDAELPAGSFGLAAAASSFHWVEEDVGLARILGALRPGGWFAMWWTLFGDRRKPDAFIAATTPLLENLDASPTKGKEGRPSHGRDREARVAALEAAGFVDVGHELAEWEASWDTAGIRALYGSFSPILRLEDAKRTELLDEIARIADEDFGGRVSRAITTALYTARRPE